MLASTVLGGAGIATAAESTATTDTASSATTLGEVIVTASKREENLQKVPLSVQALDTKTLSKLNIANFQDYVKFMPSVAFQSAGPNTASIYMRGIASGDNANHSGPLPSVGTYLDEQPITTIGGTLDIHIYDIARVEVLPGPQGTLYGASSESGTLRIITNKPTTSGFSGGFNLEGNTVDHGGQGGTVEGFVNVPLASNIAIRLVGFAERDAGYIDNVPGTRPFVGPPANTIDNSHFVKNDFNHVDTIGGRAALKIDLGSSWTIMPTVVAQELWAPGVFGYEPSVGALRTQRFNADKDRDRWLQAALNINGKLGRYDLTYSGSYFSRAVDTLSDYTDYSVAYEQVYQSNLYWVDANGNGLPNPQQEIVGHDRFDKESNEIRIASPSTDRFRFIVGLFQQRQTHLIVQDYQIQGLGPQISVTGWPNTIWLTDQNRVDRDEAVFAEASFDISSKFTISAGIRGYHYNNSLVGFFGFGAGYSSHTGESQCHNYPGQTFRDAPCVDLNHSVAASGETHKINLTYHIDDQKLVYFTYSTGYRPGGVNRRTEFGPYQADTLDNYEIGWKTSWLDRSLRFNGALYDEEWNKFQFSFLGLNSFTIVENAPSARVLGVEASLDWQVSSHFNLSSGGAYNHAELTKNFCGTDINGLVIPTCSDADALALHGQQLPYTPRFKGNLTGRYTFELGDWNAHVQASVLYQSMNFAGLRTADNALLGTMPGYATADFSIGAERKNLSVDLYIKNAFDTRGQQNRYTSCTTAVCAASYPGVPAALYVVPIQPMTIGIKLGEKF